MNTFFELIRFMIEDTFAFLIRVPLIHLLKSINPKFAGIIYPNNKFFFMHFTTSTIKTDNSILWHFCANKTGSIDQKL